MLEDEQVEKDWSGPVGSEVDQPVFTKEDIIGKVLNLADKIDGAKHLSLNLLDSLLQDLLDLYIEVHHLQDCYLTEELKKELKKDAKRRGHRSYPVPRRPSKREDSVCGGSARGA